MELKDALKWVNSLKDDIVSPLLGETPDAGEILNDLACSADKYDQALQTILDHIVSK